MQDRLVFQYNSAY